MGRLNSTIKKIIPYFLAVLFFGNVLEKPDAGVICVTYFVM
jgi:hypothetical protein